MGAVLLFGGAAAAVIARREPEPPAGPLDDKGVQPLVDEINRLKSEIRQLNVERQKLIDIIDKQKEVDVGELRRQLQAKDTQIQELVKKVDELTTRVQPRAAPPPKPPSQGFQVVNAIQDAGGIFDPCFDEWGERRGEDGTLHTEANMVVRLTVNPDGVPHSASATGESSPSLKICLELAVVRIKFPAGPEQLDLEVNIGWSQGMLNVAPRVVARREAPRSNLELQ